MQLQTYVAIADVGKAMHPLQGEAQEAVGVLRAVDARCADLVLHAHGVRVCGWINTSQCVVKRVEVAKELSED